MARKKTTENEGSLERAIRMAVDSGKVEFGMRVAYKRSLSGAAKAFVLSANCPKYQKVGIEKFAALSGVAVLSFPGTSVELGSVCGRPHPVSVLAVQDAGNSKILSLAKKEEANG